MTDRVWVVDRTPEQRYHILERAEGREALQCGGELPHSGPVEPPEDTDSDRLCQRGCFEPRPGAR